MTTKLNKEDLEFDSSVTENSKGSPILGRITGPCADIVSATRNGRKYSEALWERVFKDPIVKEYFAAGGIFGELNHPTDREETDLEKVAICMPEPPKKNADGKLIGYWDILDTPNGRIAHCLFKYGYKLGISSRGSGDTYTDRDGQESVDPESYTLQGFDLVYLPAVKAARLSLVNESFDTSGRTLRRALTEALQNSTEDERRIMTETLDKLNIDYSPEDEVIEEAAASKTTPEKGDNIDSVEGQDTTAEDNGVDLIAQLQEAIQLQNELESTIKTLNEKLSVCYTKETRYVEALRKNKSQLEQANKESKMLSEQIAELTSADQVSKKTIQSQAEKITILESKLNSARATQQKLNENLDNRSSDIDLLQHKISTLNEKYSKESKSWEAEKRKLEESLHDAQKDAQIVRSKSNADSVKAHELVEKYKAIAKKAVDKYIDLHAMKLGVSSQDIKKRLNENYSFNDIDQACEDLQSYKVNMNSLPFSVRSSIDNRRPTEVKMRIRESKEVISPSLNIADTFDDDVDDSLLQIIK